MPKKQEEDDKDDDDEDRLLALLSLHLTAVLAARVRVCLLFCRIPLENTFANFLVIRDMETCGLFQS